MLKSVPVITTVFIQYASLNTFTPRFSERLNTDPFMVLHMLRFPSNKPMDHFHNPYLGFKPQTSPSHPKLERGFGSYNYLGFSFRNSEHVNFKK